MNQPQPPARGAGSRVGLSLGIGLLALAGVVMLGSWALLESRAAAIDPRPTAAPIAAVASPSSPPPVPSGAAAPSTAAPSTAARSTAAPSTAAGTFEPSPAATPAPTPALDPPPQDGPFAIDLYRQGDFVTEARKIWCVPAAMMTMVNIMTPGADDAVATEKRFYALARELSPPTLKGDGAEPEGWAAALDQLGFGPYAVVVQPTRTAAIRAAATALRLTGRPVGFLVWRGAHSWVMSGFRATADPALTDRFTVTHVYIEDVWYPRVSSIWGRSRPPDSLVPVSRLPEDFLRWKRPTGPYPDKDGKFVLVVPMR